MLSLPAAAASIPKLAFRDSHGERKPQENQKEILFPPPGLVEAETFLFGFADKHTWLKKWRQRNRDWLKLAQMDDLDTNLADGLLFIEKLNIQLVNYVDAQLSSIMWILHPKLRVPQISKECCESEEALAIQNFYCSSHFACLKFTISKKQSLDMKQPEKMNWERKSQASGRQ